MGPITQLTPSRRYVGASTTFADHLLPAALEFNFIVIAFVLGVLDLVLLLRDEVLPDALCFDLPLPALASLDLEVSVRVEDGSRWRFFCGLALLAALSGQSSSASLCKDATSSRSSLLET